MTTAITDPPRALVDVSDTTRATHGRSVTGAAAPRRSPSGPIASGLRDMLPVVAAVAPFGMVVGVATAALDVPLPAALAGASLIYGGSAHLAAVGALAAGTAALAAVLTAVLVNARLLLYSADLARSFAGQPRWFRVVGSLTIIDQTHALLPAGLTHGPDGLRRYWVTIGATLGTGWLLAVAAGSVLGDVVPDVVPVGAAPKAVFVAMLLGRLTDRRMRRAAATAALVAVLGAGLPAGLGVMAALIAAMAVSPAPTSAAADEGGRDTDAREEHVPWPA